MMPIFGKPLIGYLLDRLQRSLILDEVVVATSSRPNNDVIQSYCDSRGVFCFRGSETDVLERLLQALRWRNATTAVLVFGDCPLIDPDVVTQVTNYFQESRQYDFVGNDLYTTYPAGMEVEVFSMHALEDSANRCISADIREHGTLYIRTHPKIYRIHNLDAPLRWRRPDLVLEVDTIEDITVVQKIVGHFRGRSDFSLVEIIEFMDKHPDISALNQEIPRRWKRFRDE
jgi:spore coat polysaccharide biosynthesis protein SpsF (cytidylyltransferase family)